MPPACPQLVQHEQDSPAIPGSLNHSARLHDTFRLRLCHLISQSTEASGKMKESLHLDVVPMESRMDLFSGTLLAVLDEALVGHEQCYS